MCSPVRTSLNKPFIILNKLILTTRRCKLQKRMCAISSAKPRNVVKNHVKVIMKVGLLNSNKICHFQNAITPNNSADNYSLYY